MPMGIQCEWFVCVHVYIWNVWFEVFTHYFFDLSHQEAIELFFFLSFFRCSVHQSKCLLFELVTIDSNRFRWTISVQQKGVNSIWLPWHSRIGYVWLTLLTWNRRFRWKNNSGFRISDSYLHELLCNKILALHNNHIRWSSDGEIYPFDYHSFIVSNVKLFMGNLLGNFDLCRCSA